MAWCKENPGVRFPKLAEEIHMFVKKGEDDVPIWSPLALDILDQGPNRSIILEIYASRFYPRGRRSGSFADAFSPYLALAKHLQMHNDPLVAAWAKKQANVLTKQIAEGRKRERSVDESFE